VLARLGLLAAYQRWRVVDEWPTLAGESLARHATALRVEGDTLVVGVTHPVVMHEMSHRKAELLAKIQAHGDSATSPIRNVRFVLGSS
jgi:predicted nucleic acid-binding Zn ribbon protein